MLAQYKRSTNIGVGVGFLLQVAGQVLSNNDAPGIGLVVLLVGLAMFIWGCGQYARGKGYSPWFGALGLLSIIGLIVLVLFPDKHKSNKLAA